MLHILNTLWLAVRSACVRLGAPHRTAPLPAPAEPEPPVQPAAPQDALAHAFAHLEYFGYQIEPENDDWYFARHPVRLDFHLRAFPTGLRFHYGAAFQRPLGDARTRWLEFLNRSNADSLMSQFTLAIVEGCDALRVRALFTGAYERRAFGLAVEMWHEDLALLRQAPILDPADAEDSDRAEDAQPATVH